MSTELLRKYNEAKSAYYAGTPIMTDTAFDALEKLLSTEYPLITKIVGSVQRGGKVMLPTPMGSLDQVHDDNELNRWYDSFTTSTNIDLIFSEKIDGNSCLLQYEDGVLVNSFSRGDGVMGANNIRHTSAMKSVPKVLSDKFTGTIRGELVIPKATWLEVSDLATRNSGRVYANSRNFVAGFMNGTDGYSAIYPYFVFVAFDVNRLDFNKDAMFDWLSSNNFVTPNFMLEDKRVSYDKFQHILKSIIDNSIYELDGIVLEVNDKKYRDTTFDLDDLNPNHAVKIKVPSKAIVTKVTKVEWNVSKDSILKPTVHFDPVQLTGVTISKATGHNARNVKEMGIGEGAIVSITRQGDVIPRVNEVIVKAPFSLPPNCKWDENHVELISTDITLGNHVAIQQLLYFFSTLEVEFLGEGNIKILVNNDITTTIDAILAKDELYAGLLGENGKKAVQSLRSKLNGVPYSVFFAATGIFGRGISVRKLKQLFNEIEFTRFLHNKVSVSDICKIDGFEVKTAEKIIDAIPGLINQFKLIKDVVKFETAPVVVDLVGNKYAGQIICPTGVRFTKEQYDMIVSNGGQVTDSFSSSVTILVAKDITKSSSKIEKARSKGIKVISLAEFQKGLIC